MEEKRAPVSCNRDCGSGRFAEISWEEAIDSIAKRLDRALESSGPSSIFHLGGSGSCRGAVHHTGRLSMRFLNLLGGYYGTGEVGSDPATFSDSRLIVLWGANICDTRFGCQLEGYIRQAKNDGTPVIVIDPRKSRTVDQLASEWIPIYHGTVILSFPRQHLSSVRIFCFPD